MTRCRLWGLALVLVAAGVPRGVRAEDAGANREQLAWRVGAALADFAVEVCDEREMEEILDEDWWDPGEAPHSRASKAAQSLGIPLPDLPPLSYEDASKNVPVVVRYLLEKEVPEWRKLVVERHGAEVDRYLAFSLSLHLHAWSEPIFWKEAEQWKAKLWKDLSTAHGKLALPKLIWARLAKAADENVLHKAIRKLDEDIELVLSPPAARESPPPGEYRAFQHGGLFTALVGGRLGRGEAPGLLDGLLRSAWRVQAATPAVPAPADNASQAYHDLRSDVAPQIQAAMERIRLLYGDRHAAAFSLGAFVAILGLASSPPGPGATADLFTRVAGATSLPAEVWKPTESALRAAKGPQEILMALHAGTPTVLEAYKKAHQGSPEHIAEEYRMGVWWLCTTLREGQDQPTVKWKKRALEQIPRLSFDGSIADLDEWLRAPHVRKYLNDLDALAPRAAALVELGWRSILLGALYETGKEPYTDSAIAVARLARQCHVSTYWAPVVAALDRSASADEVRGAIQKAMAATSRFLEPDD